MGDWERQTYQMEIYIMTRVHCRLILMISYSAGPLPELLIRCFYTETGVLVNSFLGGTGANATMLNDIINMPPLYIDMSGSSPDFTINFSGYGSLPIENTSANAGSDNGYIREADGACASWVKSSSQINHTPKVTNGSLGSSGGNCFSF